MVKVTYIEASGTAHTVNVEVGLSVKEGALRNNVPGILADCGGHCSCGTCRVYVDEAWREKTGKASELEEGLLELGDDPMPGKRLSCQIEVVPELDGLVVRMPERQF